MTKIRLFYASVVSDEFDPAQLEDILDTARERNEREGITGVLFFSSEYFVQCLEGDPRAVNNLYNDMMQDSRHHSLALMSYGEIEKRMFSSWRMAYIAPGEISEEILRSHSMGSGFDPCTVNESMANAMLTLLAKHLERSGDAA